MTDLLAPARTGMIDCFAGIGGFAHALTDPRFGYEVALTVEMDPIARHAYHASFPGHDPARTVVNIRQLTWRTPDGALPTADTVAAFEAADLRGTALRPATDEEIRAGLRSLGADPDIVGMICGGFPCQPFSKSGAQQGVADPTRGTLFDDLARLIEAVQPDHALLENVPNLAGARHRDWFTTILARLRAAGYGIGDDEVYLSPDRLAPELGGTPQIRKRLFFAARHLSPADRSDPAATRTGVSVDALADLFSWDPARWDAEEICDPDDSFDTAPYLLADREVVWITAWNDLIQALPCDDLPGDLLADAFTRGYEVPAGTHPAKAAKLRRSHALYLDHADVIDGWLTRTWPLDGEQVGVRDFPATRRILEWQARTAQPAAADRDLWQTTFSFRSSGIRVKPLTTLPALVALNTTSAIGPRGRYITPREAMRLQGMPVPVWEPPRPAPNHRTLPIPAGGGWPAAPLEVSRTWPEALARLAETITDLWWERGGFCDDAVHAALAGADTAGVTPGEALLAAGALAGRQLRWRGSGLRHTDLAWDTYRMLAAAGDPVAFDPAFAAVDWRVRRRLTIDAARTAGAPRDLDADGALAWFADRVQVRLPHAGETWADRGADLADAARGWGFDIGWLRAVHRSALLARWDTVHHPLTGLTDLDAALADAGLIDVRDPSPSGTAARVHAAYRASQTVGARRLELPAPAVASRNAGTGPSSALLPLTETTLDQGRGRIAQISRVWSDGVDRASRLARTGQRDPRTEAAILDAQRQYVLAAYDLRRHRAMRDQLRHAAYVAAALSAHASNQGAPDPGLGDAAVACVQAWARYILAPPLGPAPALVLPDVPDAGEPPAWLAAVPEDAADLDGVLARADAVVAIAASDAGTAGAVMAAHYERTRTTLNHLLDLVAGGHLDAFAADQVAFALARIPTAPDLVASAAVTAEWVSRHVLAGADPSWAALTSPGRHPQPLTA